MLHRIARVFGRKASLESAPLPFEFELEESSLNCSDVASYFLLDEMAIYNVLPKVKLSSHPEWMHTTHLKEGRYSLVLAAGECLQASALNLFPDSKLYIRLSAALPNISADGLTCSISFFDDRDRSHLQIGTFYFSGGNTSSEWRTIDFDLAWLAGGRGYLLIECGPGPDHDATADWLAISDLCVAREGEMKALLAKTHHQMRIKNEIAHFSAAYRNEMYSKVQDRQSEAAQGVVRSVRQLNGLAHSEEQGKLAGIVVLEPFEGEVAYSYATRLLRASVPDTPPDYEARLRQKVREHGTIKGRLQKLSATRLLI